MSGGAAILELQRLDLEADALRAERAALPERAAIAEIDAAAAVAAEERDTREQRGRALADEERALEAESETVRAEAAKVEADLYGGQVKALSELEGLQSKLASLRAAHEALEERQLELLEAQDAEQTALEALTRRTAELAEERRSHERSLAEGEARLDGKLGRIVEARGTVVPNVPATPLRHYEQLRLVPRLAGRAAVRLDGDRCVACRVKLPLLDVRRVREADAATVVTCPSCQRILVL